MGKREKGDRVVFEFIELDALARRNDPMPGNLNSAQQRLFQGLRSLYSQYRAGYIDKDIGKREKSMILQTYEIDMLYICAFADAVEIRRQVGYLLNDKSGCPVCRRVARILDGREKI